MNLPRQFLHLAAGALSATLVTVSPSGAIAQRVNWVTAWATSQQALGNNKITNATIRMIARVTVPGDSIRIRLDNTFGLVPVNFGKASVGPRIRGPAVAEGLIKSVTFGSKNSVTIPAGASIVSDPVALRVEAQQDLAVSLFVPAADAQPSQHNNAYVTSYLTANGAGDSDHLRGWQAIFRHDDGDVLAQVHRRTPHRRRRRNGNRGVRRFHYRRHLFNS
jgi:hypothetical protein